MRARYKLLSFRLETAFPQVHLNSLAQATMWSIGCDGTGGVL